MLTVNGALYKDVEPKDFYHYFQETAMVWKISPNKKRLFIVGSYEDAGQINGSYLTRESMFKNKKLDFDKWWETLDPIVMSPMLFNVGAGCALWKHPLAKNLRKSFPWKTNQIAFYGNIAQADKSMQNIASIAFGELYGRPKTYPTLRDGLEQVVTLACEKRFILNRSHGNIFLLGRYIGDLEGNKIHLDHNKAVFVDLLNYVHKIPLSQITVKPAPKPEVAPPPIPADVAIPMKDNGAWIAGQFKNAIFPHAGYIVYFVHNPDKVEWRTYKGQCPVELPVGISDGWTIYDMWESQL